MINVRKVGICLSLKEGKVLSLEEKRALKKLSREMHDLQGLIALLRKSNGKLTKGAYSAMWYSVSTNLESMCRNVKAINKE